MTAFCRSCEAPLARELIDLGRQPLANSYLEPSDEAVRSERRYPLRVLICDTCFLVQVETLVPADAIFHDDYAYFSSFSSSWVNHARRYVAAMQARFRLGPESLAIEIASNDGYLLQFLVAAGIPCLGIEPAGNCAAAAVARGVPTVVDFFSEKLAGQLRTEGRSADLMIANNVLAHVPDMHDFIAGFRTLLKPDGVATFEFPHLLAMISEGLFDTIYHEHYSYLSLAVAKAILEGHALRVFDVERLTTHGGSLRVFACRDEAGHAELPSVRAVLEEEARAGLNRPSGYGAFATRAAEIRQGFRMFLEVARRQGETVAAYGAAAKGNTFLNFCGSTAADICFVVDRNPQKQGKLLPGSHIPVCDPAELTAQKPEKILILPWNLATEIAAEHAYVSQWGGKFFIASPTVQML